MLARLESRAQSVRLAVYAAVVSYTTARTTYALTYLQPDRPFTSGHIALVCLIGIFTFFHCAMVEATWDTGKVRYVVWASSLFAILGVHILLNGWLSPSAVITCDQSFSYVVMGMPGTHVNVASVQQAFGNDVKVWKGLDHASYVDVKNMTESHGIDAAFPEAHKHLVARVMSVYDALDFYTKDAHDWIVMFEDTAKPLPQFHAKLAAFACKNIDKDVLWLHGPSAIRWTLTGQVDDGCVGMAYKRTSIERVMRWIELDGKGVLRAQKKHGEESEEVVSVNTLVSDACWSGEIKCAAAPLVVESKMRMP